MSAKRRQKPRQRSGKTGFRLAYTSASSVEIAAKRANAKKPSACVAYRVSATFTHPSEPPLLAPKDVYIAVGERAACYHTTWCDAMNGTWLDGYTIAVVSLGDALKQRRSCRLCEPTLDPLDYAIEFDR